MSNSNDGKTAKASRLTRADILAAALELLDEVGLPDLSMRRLAAKLDMQPSGLYWHFENKQTLFAKISDHIVEHIQPDRLESTDWQARTLSAACALRDSLLAYRDGAEVVSSTLALGLGAGAALERLRLPLAEADITEPQAKVASESILFLVLGQVWHLQQRMAADSLGVASPMAQANVAEAHAEPKPDALISGVKLILGGLEKEIRA